MKRMLGKFFKPGDRAIIITDIIALPLIIIALAFLTPKGPVSYIAYLLSSYALVITVIGFKKLIRHTKDRIKNDEIRSVAAIKRLMRKNKYTALYLESRAFRAEVSLCTALAFNLFYALFKIITGIYDGSVWLISIGIYYLVFAGARFMLMRYNRSGDPDTDRKLYEYKVYRLCGCTMMFLNITITGMSVQMIWQNKASTYSRVVVIISAAFTFYFFILAIVNVVSFRRSENAILLATKDLSLSDALMSMFSLQNSMLHTFGGDDERTYRLIMNSVTGGVVLFAVLGIATYMIINGTKMINRYSKEKNYE